MTAPVFAAMPAGGCYPDRRGSALTRLGQAPAVELVDGLRMATAGEARPCSGGCCLCWTGSAGRARVLAAWADR